jgi:hypothetical protein
MGAGVYFYATFILSSLVISAVLSDPGENLFGIYDLHVSICWVTRISSQ